MSVAGGATSSLWELCCERVAARLGTVAAADLHELSPRSLATIMRIAIRSGTLEDGHLGAAPLSLATTLPAGHPDRPGRLRGCGHPAGGQH